MNMEIRECLSCADCEFNAEHDCPHCENRPAFCRAHFIQHLAREHYGNLDAETRACALARETKYPEHHPCKWHEGDDPTIQDPNPDNYMPPGCQGCGAMYPTKDCEDTPLGKGCGLEFLDWKSRGFDDVIAGPYVTSSGDLFCQRCGPRYDAEEEEESDYDYDYDSDY